MQILEVPIFHFHGRFLVTIRWLVWDSNRGAGTGILGIQRNPGPKPPINHELIKQSNLKGSNHLLRRVAWNRNTMRFGGDCTPLAHPLTGWARIFREESWPLGVACSFTALTGPWKSLKGGSLERLTSHWCLVDGEIRGADRKRPKTRPGTQKGNCSDGKSQLKKGYPRKFQENL